MHLLPSQPRMRINPIFKWSPNDVKYPIVLYKRKTTFSNRFFWYKIDFSFNWLVYATPPIITWAYYMVELLRVRQGIWRSSISYDSIFIQEDEIWLHVNGDNFFVHNLHGYCAWRFKTMLKLRYKNGECIREIWWAYTHLS